MDDYRKMWQ